MVEIKLLDAALSFEGEHLVVSEDISRTFEA